MHGEINTQETHPANTIDFDAIAEIFAGAMSGETEHWDKDMIRIHPEMGLDVSQEAGQILDNCVDRGMAEDYIEHDDPKAPALIRAWSLVRAPECRKKMLKIPIEDGHVLAHRIIAAKVEDLKNPLGIFWSHDFPNWPDPKTPWGNNMNGVPTLVLEGKIPVEAINWEYSALALMSWLLGDTESELRVYPGYSIRNVKATYLKSGKKVEVPDQNWIS